jgi:hypothetical protein
LPLQGPSEVGPFALQSTNDSLVLLQTFTGVVSLTALILAAATIERRKAAATLRQRADELVTLNESSRIFLDNAELPSIYQAICQLAVTRLKLDATWIETDGRGAFAGELAAAYGVPMEQIPDVRSRWQHRLPAGMRSTELVRTIDELEDSGPPAGPHRALAAVPLLIGGRPFGMLNLLSTDKQFFTPGACCSSSLCQPRSRRHTEQLAIRWCGAATASCMRYLSGCSRQEQNAFTFLGAARRVRSAAHSLDGSTWPVGTGCGSAADAGPAAR